MERGSKVKCLGKTSLAYTHGEIYVVGEDDLEEVTNCES